jgi:hypothetical protein
VRDYYWRESIRLKIEDNKNQSLAIVLGQVDWNDLKDFDLCLPILVWLIRLLKGELKTNNAKYDECEALAMTTEITSTFVLEAVPKESLN